MKRLLSLPPLPKAAFYSLLTFWVSLAFSSALREIACTAAIVFWLIIKFREKNWKIDLDQCVWVPLAFYIGIAVLSFFWSEYRHESFRGIFKVLKEAAVFLMAVDLFKTESQLQKWEMAFAVLLAVVIIDGWYQYLIGKDFLRRILIQDSGAGLRVTASFKTYGLFACYLIMTIPILAGLGLGYRSSAENRKKWYFCLAFTLLALPLLFLTRSRGAWLALTIPFLFFLIFTRRFYWLAFVVLLFASSIIILPHSMIIHLDIKRREQSLVERYFLWDRALHVIEAKPLTGTGINTYTAAHAKYDKRQSWRVRNYYAHNGYLQMAAETGLISLFCFLWFLIQYFWIPLKKISTLPAPAQSALWGFVISNLSFLAFAVTDTVLHNSQPALAFWFLLGLQWTYFRFLEKQK